MKFVARQKDDKWYLAISHGRLIEGTVWPDGEWKQFAFQTAAQARACAKGLNERFLEGYEATAGGFHGTEENLEMISYIQSCLPTTPRLTKARRSS